MRCGHRNPDVPCVLPVGHVNEHWDGFRRQWPDTRPRVAWVNRIVGSVMIVAAVIMAFDHQWGISALFFGAAALWTVAAVIEEQA